MSFSIYSIGERTELSVGCGGAQTVDEFDSTSETLGADRARGKVCE